MRPVCGHAARLAPQRGEEVSSVIYFAVFVEDRHDGTRVVVGDMLGRGEALRLARTISEFNACGVFIVESQYSNTDRNRKRRDYHDMRDM